MTANASPALRVALAYYEAWTSKDVDRAITYIAACGHDQTALVMYDTGGPRLFGIASQTVERTASDGGSEGRRPCSVWP